MNNKIEVIGIDHGWSNIKTSSQVFVTGVKEITTEPALFDGVLEYKGRYYKVGGNRQEVKSTKTEDDTFYLLTLAAVAKELRRRGLCEAKVFLAVGLPLTRFGSEKSDFVKYLTAERDIEFLFENIKYHVVIENVAVFPQCYAAVADKLQTFNKKTLIVDIGSWTIDIMPVVDKVPDESKCVTIPKGLITCMRTINEQYYAEGDLVATVVTGEDGKAKVSDLPLGKYRVVEVEAPYGYVLNKEEQYVTFVYVDDKTPVIRERKRNSPRQR